MQEPRRTRSWGVGRLTHSTRNVLKQSAGTLTSAKARDAHSQDAGEAEHIPQPEEAAENDRNCNQSIDISMCALYEDQQCMRLDRARTYPVDPEFPRLTLATPHAGLSETQRMRSAPCGGETVPFVGGEAEAASFGREDQQDDRGSRPGQPGPARQRTRADSPKQA